MSKIEVTVQAKIYLELTEGEAGALQAICAYGPNQFLDWFKRNMGESYIRPYRDHIKTLFVKARALDSAINQVKEARMKIGTINC